MDHSAVKPLRLATYSVFLLLFCVKLQAWRPHSTQKDDSVQPLKFEGSSNLVQVNYHQGPVLSQNLSVNVIWYGNWTEVQKTIIRDFVNSFSVVIPRVPTVHLWWVTARKYADQTGGYVTPFVSLGTEMVDESCSHGKRLTRMSIQQVIANNVKSRTGDGDGIYLVLTSADVEVQDFCKAVCGFHFFTFPATVGFTVPYAWIGNSVTQCPSMCAYPFSTLPFMNMKAKLPPNGDVGVDGMMSVIAHELAEMATNPFGNGWYAGDDLSFPQEIADLCEGIYGSGGGGSYMGNVLSGPRNVTYNMIGAGRRPFLVQWLWDNKLKYCRGPNAVD